MIRVKCFFKSIPIFEIIVVRSDQVKLPCVIKMKAPPHLLMKLHPN